jgi:hypothetical protein
MRAFLLTIALVAAVPAVCAQSSPSDAQAATRGEHPAIVARRVIAQQGYDHTTKFYPHPAWLYLSAEAPRPMSDHPAVLVYRRAQEERRATLEAAARELAQR